MSGDVVGQVVGGGFGNVVIRQKEGTTIEIGELLVSESENQTLIMQVFDLEYGSQMQDKMQQMISGVSMEMEPEETSFYEPGFVNYVLANIKPLGIMRSDGTEVAAPKSLPPFMRMLRRIESRDLKFLRSDRDSIFLGHIRSGSRVIGGSRVMLPTQDVFSHHVLIPAATGRGKSNLVKCIMWNLLESSGVGALILDAHDEYYGRSGTGLKDHPDAFERSRYYTPSAPPAGAMRLNISLESIRPEHFEGIVDLSEAQQDASQVLYREHRKRWIQGMMSADPDELKKDSVKQVTIKTIQRKMKVMLGIRMADGQICAGKNDIFVAGGGEHTVSSIVEDVEDGKVVILDTSKISSEAELLIGNIIATELLDRHKRAKTDGRLDRAPIVTIVIEEAPRVIGDEMLKGGDNAYSTIAKEGRKFKIGLTAITQLSSVISRTILANMNTKIILGNEMKQEREAIIASASQDLTEDSKGIASLDKGEAIVTSIFVPFALPIKIPLFEEMARDAKRERGVSRVV